MKMFIMLFFTMEEKGEESREGDPSITVYLPGQGIFNGGP